MSEREPEKYEVRRGDDGKMGIYLRAYNVRLAVFNVNSAKLQKTLTSFFTESKPKK